MANSSKGIMVKICAMALESTQQMISYAKAIGTKEECMEKVARFTVVDKSMKEDFSMI